MLESKAQRGSLEGQRLPPLPAPGRQAGGVRKACFSLKREPVFKGPDSPGSRPRSGPGPASSSSSGARHPGGAPVSAAWPRASGRQNPDWRRRRCQWCPFWLSEDLEGGEVSANYSSRPTPPLLVQPVGEDWFYIFKRLGEKSKDE